MAKMSELEELAIGVLSGIYKYKEGTEEIINEKPCEVFSMRTVQIINIKTGQRTDRYYDENNVLRLEEECCGMYINGTKTLYDEFGAVIKTEKRYKK